MGLTHAFHKQCSALWRKEESARMGETNIKETCWLVEHWWSTGASSQPYRKIWNVKVEIYHLGLWALKYACLNRHTDIYSTKESCWCIYERSTAIIIDDYYRVVVPEAACSYYRAHSSILFLRSLLASPQLFYRHTILRCFTHTDRSPHPSLDFLCNL